MFPWMQLHDPINCPNVRHDWQPKSEGRIFAHAIIAIWSYSYPTSSLVHTLLPWPHASCRHEPGVGPYLGPLHLSTSLLKNAESKRIWSPGCRVSINSTLFPQPCRTDISCSFSGRICGIHWGMGYVWMFLPVEADARSEKTWVSQRNWHTSNTIQRHIHLVRRKTWSWSSGAH